MSLPLPTMLGRGPLAGGFGYFDGRPQGTSFHSFSGYNARKHPFFGSGTLLIASCQSFRSRNSSGESWLGAGAVVVAAVAWATACGDVAMNATAAIKVIAAADNIRMSAAMMRTFVRTRFRLSQRGIFIS